MNQDEYIASWFQRNESRTDMELVIGGLRLLVRKEVFCPDPTLTHSTSQVLANLPDVKGKRVLDLGTGSGVLAMIAASRGASEVVGVDIDPHAVANALENRRRLGLEGIVNIHQGNLYEPVSGAFDLILAALPILNSAWEGKGVSVTKTFVDFFAGLSDHLAPSGQVMFNFASFGDFKSLEEALRACSRRWRIVEETKFGVDWQLYISSE